MDINAFRRQPFGSFMVKTLHCLLIYYCPENLSLTLKYKSPSARQQSQFVKLKLLCMMFNTLKYIFIIASINQRPLLCVLQSCYPPRILNYQPFTNCNYCPWPLLCNIYKTWYLLPTSSPKHTCYLPMISYQPL